MNILFTKLFLGLALFSLLLNLKAI